MDIVKDKAEFEEIVKNNPSVFVDFYADWCGPCKMVSPLVEKLAEKNTDVKFVKVNVDDNPDVAQQFGVMSIPTLIAIKEGSVAGQSVGFQPEEALQAVVDKAK